MKVHSKNEKEILNQKQNAINENENKSKESNKNLNQGGDNKQRVYTKVIPAQNDRYKKSRSKDLNISNLSNNDSTENNKNYEEKNSNMISIRLDDVKDVHKEFNPLDLNNYQDGIVEKVYLNFKENSKNIESSKKSNTNNSLINTEKKDNKIIVNSSFELNYDKEIDTRITGKFVNPNEENKDNLNDITNKNANNTNGDLNVNKNIVESSTKILENEENKKKITYKEKVSAKNVESKDENENLENNLNKDKKIEIVNKDMKDIQTSKNPFLEEEKNDNVIKNTSENIDSELKKGEDRKKKSGNCNCIIF